MEPQIETLPLFRGLTRPELELIRGCLREKSFEKGEVLFLEGNECQQIFFVKSGRVKLYRTASSGREQILESLGPGDTCACNPGCTVWSCVSTGEALTRATVWYLNREDYTRLVESNSKLAHTLNRLFAEKLKRFSCLIDDVSLKDVRKRLIQFLLDMLRETPKKGEGNNSVPIPFTREEIAQRIGTSRETVTRYLHELKRKKLIKIKPHQIIIRDEKKLNELIG